VQVRLEGEWRSLRNNFNGALLRRASSILLRENGEIWAGTNPHFSQSNGKKPLNLA
jgi:hypothetical protein